MSRDPHAKHADTTHLESPTAGACPNALCLGGAGAFLTWTWLCAGVGTARTIAHAAGGLVEHEG